MYTWLQACQYMQPLEFAMAAVAHKKYEYPNTHNDCTFISIKLVHFSLDLVGVPAGLEADGVGMFGSAFRIVVLKWPSC